MQKICYYRPYPKNGESNVFTGVCLFTWGYPCPRFFPRSVVPGPFLGGTTVLAGGNLNPS